MRIVAALLFAAFALSAPLAGAAPQVDPAVAARQGVSFVVGMWTISGEYDQQSSQSVGFDVTFYPNGTFIDRDGFTGRWIISGDTFSMYYPDESQLGYVGRISGDVVTGRFEGLDNSGTFQMRQIGR